MSDAWSSVLGRSLPSSEEPDRMSAPLQVVTYVHESNEGLALFRGPLVRSGFRPVVRLRSPGPTDARAPLLVVMGGPMGVYDAGRFPFLQAELDVLRAR